MSNKIMEMKNKLGANRFIILISTPNNLRFIIIVNFLIGVPFISIFNFFSHTLLIPYLAILSTLGVVRAVLSLNARCYLYGSP